MAGRRWAPIAALVQERARTLAEVYSMVDFLYLPEIDIDQAEWDKLRKRQPAFVALLEGSAGPLCRVRVGGNRRSARPPSRQARPSGSRLSGKAQAPVRLAVTGRSVGPPLFESLVLLGRQSTLARLASALDRAVAEDRQEGNPWQAPEA